MSTLGQPHLEPAWKQEVSRRIAAHKNRKPGTAAPTQENRTSSAASSRAAEAAARVAARYANARTYSEMQAEEARVAVRAAEIATKVALDAQAVAESALAEMHAASEQTLRGPAVVESIDRAPRIETVEQVMETSTAAMAEPEAAASIAIEEPPAPVMKSVVAQPEAAPIVTHEVVDGRSYDIRWEPDLPVRAMERRAPAPRVETQRVQEQFELAPEDWWTPAEVSATLHSEPFQVEAQATHANLIEFPRELVATRKMRPRLAEATAEPEAQLSIFEVDPGTVSTEAEAEAVTTARSEEWPGYVSPRYSGPEWSGIQLDAHPSTQQQVQEEPVADANRPDIAAFGLRLMATVVDCALILGVFFAAASWLVAHMHQAPALKSAEAMGIAGLLLTGLAYYGVFFGIGKITPGMRYAGIALSTFDDEVPNRTQLRRRFGAMVLSLLPVGLGLLWTIFDEDHLSWHDRISGTYLRKTY